MSAPVIVAPNGCRHYGAVEHEHCRRWSRDVGWHVWVEPTTDQRLARMRARRAAGTCTPTLPLPLPSERS